MDPKKRAAHDQPITDTKQVEKLELRIKELEKEAEDYKGKYLRALADYQNFDRRVQKEKEEMRESLKSHLMIKLLPFLDNLEKAEVFVNDKNLNLIKEQFEKLLKEDGLKEIEVINKEFDPYMAEVIDIVAGDKDNIVVEVIRKGYSINDRVLRVAQVKVSKKQDPSVKTQG